jgi:hypothetical protein
MEPRLAFITECYTHRCACLGLQGPCGHSSLLAVLGSKQAPSVSGLPRCIGCGLYTPADQTDEMLRRFPNPPLSDAPAGPRTASPPQRCSSASICAMCCLSPAAIDANKLL